MAKITRIEALMSDLVLKVKRTDAIQSFVSQETPIIRIYDADGGMNRNQLKWLKELENENQRLRPAVSDLTVDKTILTEAAREASKLFTPSAVHRSCAADPWCIGAPGLPHTRPTSFVTAQGPL